MESLTVLPEQATSEITETPEFKKWLGKSKILISPDETPQILYFGNASGIQSLHGNKRSRTGQDEIGFYLTPHRSIARFYAQSLRDPTTDAPSPGSIYRAFIKADNPVFDSDIKSTRVTQKPDNCDAIINNKLREVVVFDSDQIFIVDENPLSD